MLNSLQVPCIGQRELADFILLPAWPVALVPGKRGQPAFPKTREEICFSLYIYCMVFFCKGHGKEVRNVKERIKPDFVILYIFLLGFVHFTTDGFVVIL